MPRLVLLDDEGVEMASVEMPGPIEIEDSGRFMWPAWTAVVDLARQVTKQESGPLDVPCLVSQLIHLEWTQRAIAGGYRGLAEAFLSIITDHSKDTTRLDAQMAAVAKQETAAAKEISAMYARWGDLMRNPTGRIWDRFKEDGI